MGVLRSERIIKEKYFNIMFRQSVDLYMVVPDDEIFKDGTFSEKYISAVKSASKKKMDGALENDAKHINFDDSEKEYTEE